MFSDDRSVLLVGNMLSSPRGTRAVAEDLAEKLRLNGWSVLTTSACAKRLHRLVDMVWTAWDLRACYGIAMVDVFSGLSLFWAESVCSILRWQGKPYILVLHGGNLPSFALECPTRVRYLLRSARAVATPSSFLKDSLSWARSDILYIPNALDIERYSFRLRSRAHPRLCWLRSFNHVYNPQMAVRVLGLLAGQYPEIRLSMFGPDHGDKSITEVKRLASELGVEEKLEIAGPIDKESVPERIGEYDIFINTTNYESFGVSVMEAGALGLCIVSTAVGELPYLWTDGTDAMLVPRDDPEAMAAACHRILEDPGLARRLSANARRRAEAFSWDRTLPEYEGLLHSALDR